jgi:mannose-6-phosphate isomerase-like protein (cupin superfamily)
MLTNSTLAPHYHWGAQCDGWHLLSTPGLSVIQERMPPGTSEVRHVHAHAQQFFFVLGGVLSIEMGGVTSSLSVGDGLPVPVGVAHRVFNQGSHDASFLVVSQPPSHGDRTDVPL